MYLASIQHQCSLLKAAPSRYTIIGIAAGIGPHVRGTSAEAQRCEPVTMQTPTPPERHDHSIEFTVDGEAVTTRSSDLTPRQIMALAKVDPTTHYLVEIEGRERRSYERVPDEPIHVHEHEKFITVSTGPPPVS